MFEKQLIEKIVYEQIPAEIIDSIIIFGSRARNEENEGSDTDIFIVTKDNIERKERFTYCKKLRRAFASILNGVDIIIEPIDEFKKFCHVAGTIENTVYMEGVRL